LVYSIIVAKKSSDQLNITLDAPVSTLLSCSTAAAAKLLSGMGIETVSDLIWRFPVRYEDRSRCTPITSVAQGQTVTITGEIVSAQVVPTRSRMVVTRVAVTDGTGTAFLVFFGSKFIKPIFDKLIGRPIVAYGKSGIRAAVGRVELTDVEWELADSPGSPLAGGRIAPVYALTEGITQSKMRKMTWEALSACASELIEPIPPEMMRRLDLMPLREAVFEAHYPSENDAIGHAQKRIVFNEFFFLQLILVHRKKRKQSQAGLVFSNAQSAARELEQALPFALTDAQKRVVDEVADDMSSARSMNRLVQGDVGSGKTVIAMAAILIAVRSGYQASIMAPTEILAEQHFLNICGALEDLGVRSVFLSGSIGEKAKNLSLQAIAGGEAHVVVGTHALIQDGVSFHNLGLAVIDEQHRFGVLQRDALRKKGADPDTLVMTATPIPRTLTLTIYGDLDVSIIDELPPGRKPVRTHWKKQSSRRDVYETIRKMLSSGRQAYVICPLIEESEKLQAKAAVDLAAHLAGKVFPEFKVGLIHGAMKSAEKDETMQRFRKQEIDLLVSTTVIEVGVDVPNASIIVIEDADRFGLAQLHQLRGRVGRGNTQSYCILIADPKSADGQARMEIMTRTHDGFEIAEEDLKLRGPGEFYGTRQSGMQDLPFLDVFRDVPILRQARDEAERLLDANPMIQGDDLAQLRMEVRQRIKRLSRDTAAA
jgi:ATP-dependent DNA helicase RecG